MTKRKILTIAFFLGLLGLLSAREHFTPSFLEEAALPMYNEPDYQRILIHNAALKSDKFPGEIFLAQDIQAAMSAYYPDVSERRSDAPYPTNFRQGIHIYMRGYFKFIPPFPDYRNILLAYVLYPLFHTKPDKHKLHSRSFLQLQDLETTHTMYDELQFYDALAVASPSYAKQLKKAGYNAFYVPQFTNPDKFYPDYDERLQSEVLFVGAKRHDGAPVIALKHKLPITIYGPWWDAKIAKQPFVDNKILRKYYSSAKIVLNDHRQDMRNNGFINNRTFDVTACGTLLISDYLPEIEEIYGDSVPTWRTEEELVQLINYYLDPAHEEERKEKAKRAQEITLKNFTTKQIGKQFDNIIQTVKRRKGIQD